MISDTAASFIVLQKDFASALWVVLPTIIVFKLLLTSITAQGGQGIIHLAKGCFYSVMVLVLFNYFYPAFIGIVDGYIDIKPVSFKSETLADSFWNLLGDYGISFFAILAHAVSTSLMMLLLTIVTVTFSVSYALFAVFEFDGLWKITVKCALAVILWAGTMYFIRFDVAEASGVTDENAASYFSSIFGAACLSIVTMSLAFKYNSLVKRAKDFAEQNIEKLSYNHRREQARKDVAEGRIQTDGYGRAVFKNDYSDPEGDVLREYQENLIRSNPDVAKKYGLKSNNWKSFEEEVKEANLGGSFEDRGVDQDGYKKQRETFSQSDFKNSSYERLQTISVPSAREHSTLRSPTTNDNPSNSSKSRKREYKPNFRGLSEYNEVRTKMHPAKSTETFENLDFKGKKNFKEKQDKNDYLNIIEEETQGESILTGNTEGRADDKA